jgi:hypothetical protein
MLFRRLARGLLVGLICLGLILSPGIASAAGLEMPPGASFAAPPPVVCDVRLDSSGRLWGMLVDVQGVPLARAEVALVRPNVDLSTAVTDTLGRFSFGPLQSGMYQIWVGGGAKLIRAWNARTAPPAAQPMALVVVPGEVVRGQMPAQQFFASDTAVLTAMVGAMVALPIAIHYSSQNGRNPASP